MDEEIVGQPEPDSLDNPPIPGMPPPPGSGGGGPEPCVDETNPEVVDSDLEGRN